MVGARGEALTRVTSPKEPRPVTYIPISSIHFGAACCYGRPRLLPSRPEFLNVSERVQRGTSSFGGWIPEGHMVEPSFCGNLGNPSVIAFPPQQDAFAQLSRGCVVRPALAGESRMYGIIGVSRSPGSARGRWTRRPTVSRPHARRRSLTSSAESLAVAALCIASVLWPLPVSMHNTSYFRTCLEEANSLRQR